VEGDLLVFATGGPEEHALHLWRTQNAFTEMDPTRPNLRANLAQTRAVDTGACVPLSVAFVKAQPRSRMVVGCTDRTIRLLGNGGNSIAMLTGLADWVYSVAAAPDGQQIAAGSADGYSAVLGCQRRGIQGVQAVSVLFLVLLLAQAAKKPAAPPPNIEPPQPVLSWIYPAGAARGSTVEVLATGTSIAPDTVLVTGGGVSGKVLDAKDPNKVRLSVTVAADAEVGEREFRLLNAGGVSNRFRFLVGDLPEIMEVEPNNDKATAQKIASLPVVINGQIMDSDRDCFRFAAKTSETLVLEVKARVLLPYIADAVPGWFDPQLTVFDSAGKQVAFADDFRNSPDPVLFFRPPADGEYVVELRDVIYRGRGDFIYRLTIGVVPYVTDLFPLGGQRGTQVPVELRGVNLKSTQTTVRVAADASRQIMVEGLPFAAGDYPAVPAHDGPAPQRLALPVTVDGRIPTPGVSTWFTFYGAEGRKTSDGSSGAPPGIAARFHPLYDANKNQLAENDDWNDPLSGMLPHNADSRIVYTFNTTGDYLLRLRDVQAKGGAEYSFRLTVGPARPDFTLRVSPDNPRMGQGDTAAITVSAIRHDDFAGEIQLGVEQLPAGYMASAATIPAGQNEGRLTIIAPAGAAPCVLAPVVTGTAVVGKDTVMRRAESGEPMMQAFAYTHILPTRQLFWRWCPAPRTPSCPMFRRARRSK
jgi:hypothetical protein